MFIRFTYKNLSFYYNVDLLRQTSLPVINVLNFYICPPLIMISNYSTYPNFVHFIFPLGKQLMTLEIASD